MLNTYINENMNVPYPFYGTTKLPFPNSCILGLQVAITIAETTEESSSSYVLVGTLYASSVTLSKDAAYVMICDDNGPVFSLSAIKKGNGGTSTIIQNICANNALIYNAFMELGYIPESAYGLYTGKFYIDPSCITVLPTEVMNYAYSGTQSSQDAKMTRVNGIQLRADQCLEIRASGLLKLEDTSEENSTNRMFTIMLKPDIDINSLDLYAVIDKQNYKRVETISGVNTNTEYDKGGTELIFTVGNIDSSNAVNNSVSISANQIGNVLNVIYKGNSEFRNCFDPEEDEAGDVN